jgi:hypothetical protein
MANCSCICPPNTDSALSTASNITGILTFAIATAVTYIGYLVLFSEADTDLFRFEMDALNRFHTGTQGPFNKFSPSGTMSDSAAAGSRRFVPNPPTQEEAALHLMNESLEVFEKLQADFATLQQQSTSKLGIRRRLLWVWKRQRFVELVSKMAALRAEVLAVKTTLILRRSIGLEQMVGRQKAALEELVNRIDDMRGVGGSGGVDGGDAAGKTGLSFLNGEEEMSLREDTIRYHKIARELSF